MTKLLVATGFSKSVEILNLDALNPNLICDDLPSLPFSLYGATGQLHFKTTPIICGGSDTSYKSECHTFSNGTWKSSPSLNEYRTYSASAIFSNPNKEDDDIILITGGCNGTTLSSVESYDGQIWNEETFADLPNTVLLHCMVKLNNSMLMLIGGLFNNTNSSSASSDTHFFNVLNNKWVSGPQLINECVEPSCGIMNWINPDTETTEKVVVVAGGKDKNNNKLSSVQLLFLNAYETSQYGWVQGPSLPKTISAATMTEFQDGVILVGGQSKPIVDGRHLYQLSSPDGPWTEMKQTLKESRRRAVSFLIPDEIVNCN